MHLGMHFLLCRVCEKAGDGEDINIEETMDLRNDVGI